MELAFHVLVFFVIGIVVYYFDTKIGVKWYRSWYNLTHKDPMPDNVVAGFIYNQDFKAKLIIAIILVSIEVVVSFFLGSAPSLTDVLYGIGEFVGIILGLILAPKMIKSVPGKVKGAMDYMEKVDKGEVDLKKDLVKGAIKAGSGIKDAMSEVPKQQVTPQPQPEPKPEPAPQAEKPKEEEKKPDEPKKDDDWRGGVKKFMDK